MRLTWAGDNGSFNLSKPPFCLSRSMQAFIPMRIIAILLASDKVSSVG